MAYAEVRIKINHTFIVDDCEGTNDEEILDDIMNNGRLDEDLFLDVAYDVMTIESAEYDEPEPEPEPTEEPSEEKKP